MHRYKDLSGKKFNMITVVSLNKIENNVVFWDCICDCGNKTTLRSSSIVSGHTKSCGCWHKIHSKMHSKIHGLSKTPLYQCYHDIIQRCYNTKDRSYKNYGNRGITICNEWKNDFMSFYNWSILNGYDEKKTIERINVNGNYSPNNCCWIPKSKQNSNKRTTRYLTYNGITKNLKEWEIEYKLTNGILHHRLNLGWNEEKALNTPVKSFRHKAVK